MNVIYYGKEIYHSIDNINAVSSKYKLALDPHKYGIPELKKFPMPDAKHVKSAIKFFNYVTPAYEKRLAKAIIDRIEEYGVEEDISIGPDNRFMGYWKHHIMRKPKVKG